MYQVFYFLDGEWELDSVWHNAGPAFEAFLSLQKDDNYVKIVKNGNIVAFYAYDEYYGVKF